MRTPVAKRTSARTLREWGTAYAFLFPNVLGLFVFVFLPILYALYVSLFDWNALSPKVFAGLDNYKHLMDDKAWWRSVGKTLLFSVIYVPLLFVSSLLSAILINALKGRVSGFARTMFLMPFAITSVNSAIIAMYLLDPRSGLINWILGWFNVPSQEFLGSTSQAMFCVVAVLLWINVGYNMIIFLSAIKEIPRDYYEAAHMDGAKRFQTFRYITFPLLTETNTFILIVTTIGSFQVFDQIMVMTKGGPAGATEVSVLYIFKHAFELLNMGYSSAMAFVLFLIIFVLSLVQLKLLSKSEER
ncbi:carbohydrate ABC transporter permease [Cohnella herbarum]|uniref:Sugar ABC transporter permease n=1 Tax=Cohnella herbarum TaxID=2728023 RepID=A0A7Z2VJY7_9BACL|nr:sugar ABC transporter permease [Cohnella herbarum]QJD84240.1 sugar ABC transporter permease [Cohnella herbarum]